jgi:UDP-N-acetylmuramyl pentapeptide synthase
MEELGDEGPRLHQETGSRINIGPSDKILLVGEKAQWMKAGILQSRFSTSGKGGYWLFGHKTKSNR